MCGRFALHANEDEIVSHFHLKRGFVMKSRFNISPTQIIPIICKWQSQVEFSRFGFIPSWAKTPDGKTPMGHINARKETLIEKPTFREAFKKQRCLILASGYYEWRLLAGKKQPFYIFVKNKPLIAFAGIWSFWLTPQGENIRTCAIITTTAEGELQKLHERMPIIISSQHYQTWLAKEYDPEKIAQILVNPEPDACGFKPVSSRMSNPQFEGIECIQSL
jgi:putative SOS response-associated peptidase YedK